MKKPIGFGFSEFFVSYYFNILYDEPMKKRKGLFELHHCFGQMMTTRRHHFLSTMSIAFFTPGAGLAGGSLIGASAGVLLLSSGEILGASGLISSTVLEPEKALNDPSVSWKLLFMSTFMATSNLVSSAYAKDNRMGKDSSLPIVSTAGYLIGGFLVGFGTKLGNGCTSGHGICGMARLSKRSFIAVATFMTSAVATANIVAPDNRTFSTTFSFLRGSKVPNLYNRKLGIAATAPFVLATAYALHNLYTTVKADRNKRLAKENGNSGQEQASAKESDIIEVEPKSERKSRQELAMVEDGVGKLLPAVFTSSAFALGLAVSGMVLPSKILGFLNLHLVKKGSWDPTLMTVMAGGSAVSWISYQFVKGFGLFDHSYSMECPRRSSRFAIPTNTNVDLYLISGAVSFGVGWGIAGLCPGPALFLAASGTEPIIKFWWPTYLAGSYLAKRMKELY
eukprot:scaffold22589_cov138-Cylindrotheca_fusiformis.AAC.37